MSLVSIETKAFETAVDAHEFAEQCQIEADADIVWDCIKPGWA